MLLVVLLAVGGLAAYVWTGVDPAERRVQQSSIDRNQPDVLKGELEGIYADLVGALQEQDLGRLNRRITVAQDSDFELSEHAAMRTDFAHYAEWMLTLNPVLAKTTFVTLKTPSPDTAAYFFIWYPPERGSMDWFMRGGTHSPGGAVPHLSMRLFINDAGQWRMPFYQLIDPSDGVALDGHPGPALQQFARQLAQTDPLFDLTRPDVAPTWRSIPMSRVLITALPLILLTLFTLAAYQDLNMAEKNSNWYSVKGTVVQLDSNGHLTYEYKAQGDIYQAEYYDFQEYVGNCMQQTKPPNPYATRPEAPPCLSGKAWLRKLHGVMAPIPGWTTANTAEAAERMALQGKERAFKLAAKLSEGDRVKVYYDPDNPAAAVLQPYISGETWSKDWFRMTFYLGLGATILLALSMLPSLLGLPKWGEALVPVVIVVAVVGYFFSLRPDPNQPERMVTEKLIAVMPNESQWEKTTGTVFVSFVASRLRAGHGVYTHYPSVLYKYVVNGVTYSGLVGQGDEEGTPEAVVERYPEQLQIEVWYDPRRPKYSTLHPDRVVYEKPG